MKQTNKALKAKISQLEKELEKARSIKASNIFATPKDMKSLMAYCNGFTGPGEKTIAFTCAGMAWNLAAKVVSQ